MTSSMATVTYVLALVGIGMARGATCPANMQDFRTKSVQTSFEPAMLDGQWYEHAYIDIAQVGASCPTFNNTHDEATGVISMALSVKYTVVPFTITEVYTPYNATIALATPRSTRHRESVVLSCPLIAVSPALSFSSAPPARSASRAEGTTSEPTMNPEAYSAAAT